MNRRQAIHHAISSALPEGREPDRWFSDGHATVDHTRALYAIRWYIDKGGMLYARLAVQKPIVKSEETV